MTEHLKDVQFDFIRYANCWEDADVLLEGLQLDQNAVVMSIGSAGDNSFSLLAENPKKVIAVDISEVQFFLIELKKAAIRAFDRGDYLRFCGYSNGKNRTAQYESIRMELSEKARQYWDHNSEDIEKGVIHCGKFEKYFQLFKQEYMPKVHTQATIDELFSPKSASAQKNFHEKQWNTPAWREVYQQFFGKKMMGDHGRDPAFLQHVKGEVSEIILERESKYYQTPAVYDNYFMHYIMYNQFFENMLPHYVREENYGFIKANLDQLEIHHGLVDAQTLSEYPNCTHFNLSDIFEYMDDLTFKEFAEMLVAKTTAGTKIAYWNLMIPRVLSEVLPDAFELLEQVSEQLSRKDKGYFYGGFKIDVKL